MNQSHIASFNTDRVKQGESCQCSGDNHSGSLGVLELRRVQCSRVKCCRDGGRVEVSCSQESADILTDSSQLCSGRPGVNTSMCVLS